jgi:hypothetical protein
MGERKVRRGCTKAVTSHVRSGLEALRTMLGFRLNKDQIENSASIAHPIDYYRPMKVICIRASMSGLQTGVQFPQKIRNLELVIYEKNADVGGTGYESRYPDLACCMYF